MNNFYKISLAVLLLAATIFTSCKKEYESIQSIDDAAIQAYIKKNNLTNMKADPAGSGFYFQVLDPGAGNLLANKDSVLFNYQYKSLNDGSLYFGTAANSNGGTYLGYLAEPYYPDAFRASLAGLKYGAKVRIIIPSYLAFGKNGNTAVNIGSNEIIDAYLNIYATNKQWELDDTRIQAYLTAKGLTATKDPSRVYYIVKQLGTGTPITDKETSTVIVNYTGRLLDGTVFDSSTDGTFSTSFASAAALIKGWKLVLARYPAGTKIRLFIPSDLAYGSTAQSAVPANSVLDFDIEIVSVTNN